MTGQQRSPLLEAGTGRMWHILALVAVLLGFGLRAGTLTAQSLWRDEVDALCYAFEFPHLVAQALAPETTGDLAPPTACPLLPLDTARDKGGGPTWSRLRQVLQPMVRHNGPLYFFLLRGWIAVAGYSEYALRFFSLWFGVLGVSLITVLGARLLGRVAAGTAALLAAAAPYLVWYGQEVKMYTLVPALALLALYALRRAVESGGGWWMVQIVATSLALYTHIWSVLLVPVQLLLLIAWWPRWRSRWRAAGISLALLTLPYLPLALWQIPTAFVRRETGFPHHTLDQMTRILLNGWSAGITGRGLPWAAGICGALALVGLIATAIRFRGWKSLQHVLGWAGWLFVPLLGIWFVSRWQPLFTDRYLIWVAPAFYLLAGAGLQFLSRWGLWTLTPFLAAMLLIFGANLWAQAAVPIKSDLRAAAACVEQGYQPGDALLFQIPHIRYTFDYYFDPAGYDWVDGPYTNHRGSDGSYLVTEQAVSSHLWFGLQGSRSVWFIASEVEMWDERGLVQRWLETNGQSIEKAHFTRVDVYHYQLDGSP